MTNPPPDNERSEQGSTRNTGPAKPAKAGNPPKNPPGDAHKNERGGK